MKFGAVAARYAQALFELASEKGVLDAVSRDVEFLAQELAQPAVAALLFHQGVSRERQRELVERFGKHVNPLTFKFVRLLLEKRRTEVLRELGEAFKGCLLRQRNAVEGTVESPRPLGAGEVAAISAALSAVLRKQVLLGTRLVPELVAGARVLVDNRMIDTSAQGRLEALRAKLLASRLHS
jgi:F-type H+-transporting ATPase subunit delta